MPRSTSKNSANPQLWLASCQLGSSNPRPQSEVIRAECVRWPSTFAGWHCDALLTCLCEHRQHEAPPAPEDGRAGVGRVLRDLCGAEEVRTGGSVKGSVGVIEMRNPSLTQQEQEEQEQEEQEQQQQQQQKQEEQEQEEREQEQQPQDKQP